MLDIFILASTSSYFQSLISPSINQVESIATSNNDGFTSTSLLQQIYGTQALDGEVNLNLSDEELELIAGKPESGANVATSGSSDVIVNGQTIISLQEVLPYAEANDHGGIIQLIKERFGKANIPISTAAVERLSDHLRDEAPRVTKSKHRGLLINLSTGRECYVDTPGCTPEFLRQG